MKTIIRGILAKVAGLDVPVDSLADDADLYEARGFFAFTGQPSSSG
ncbi:hypothetical protein [Cupriavidus sp. KK10]|jgi:hypothetical protein|nr:hypothetical protein [Cupriavidus sp. KK10]